MYLYMYADAYNSELHAISVLDHFWYADDSEVYFDAHDTFSVEL